MSHFSHHCMHMAARACGNEMLMSGTSIYPKGPKRTQKDPKGTQKDPKGINVNDFIKILYLFQ